MRYRTHLYFIKLIFNLSTMKKVFLFLILIFTATCNVFSQNVSLTREQAWDILKHGVLKDRLNSVNVSVMDTMVAPNSLIKTFLKEESSPNFSSWFFFVDDEPFESWEHDCRYVFVNVMTGEYEIRNEKRPPISKCMIPLVSKKILSLNTERFNLSNVRNFVKSSPHDYAVIISGGMNLENNHERYWNDCSAIYSTLVNVYGYLKDHIYVLISDGKSLDLDRHLNNGTYASSPQDLDGDGKGDINYAATRANISTVFDLLGDKLTSDDNLFIFTTDHGGFYGSNAFMCLWNNEILKDEDFSKELNKVKAGKINICMGQCNSGGFIDDLQGDNTVIATACREDQSSYAMSNMLYDEFVFYWISAVKGKTPMGSVIDADQNNDGKISMNEAFLFASQKDTKPETPQYSSIPNELGDKLYLAQSFTTTDMNIVGKTVNCDSAMYYVNNLPVGMSVVWTRENTSGAYVMKTDYPNLNQCMISTQSYPMYYSMKLIATVYNGNEIFTVLEKDIYGKPVTFYGTYSQEACTYYGVNHPAIGNTSARENIAIYVHQGCMARIYSSHFEGMNISHTGMAPDYFNYDRKGTIQFSFPLNSGGAPMHISGTCDNSLANFDLLIFAISGNQNISGSLNIKSNVNGYDLFLPTNDGLNEFGKDNEWQLEVYNLQLGNKVYSKDILDNKYSLNTSGWKSGIYVLKVQRGNMIYTGKINVK